MVSICYPIANHARMMITFFFSTQEKQYEALRKAFVDKSTNTRVNVNSTANNTNDHERPHDLQVDVSPIAINEGLDILSAIARVTSQREDTLRSISDTNGFVPMGLLSNIVEDKINDDSQHGAKGHQDQNNDDDKNSNNIPDVKHSGPIIELFSDMVKSTEK